MGGELRIADLVSALGRDRAKLGAARKALERLEKRTEPVAAPLPAPIQARKQRQAGCGCSLPCILSPLTSCCTAL